MTIQFSPSLGDHGLIRRSQHMHPSEEKLLLSRGHVPFLLHAPMLLEPARYDKVASEVDILPTLAGLILP